MSDANIGRNVKVRMGREGQRVGVAPPIGNNIRAVYSSSGSITTPEHTQLWGFRIHTVTGRERAFVQRPDGVWLEFDAETSARLFELWGITSEHREFMRSAGR